MIENDVRLMRRYLVALQFEDFASANSIVGYLRNIRKLNMILPSEYTTFERDNYLHRLLGKERWLAKRWGCVLLPDYKDCIFLNSLWANPYLLYVRLVERVEYLGVLGDIYWVPEDKVEFWPNLADKNHGMYIEAAQRALELQIIEELKAQEIEIAREQERAIAREAEMQIAKELELEAISLAEEQTMELVRLAEEEAAKPWWKKLFQRSDNVQ